MDVSNGSLVGETPEEKKKREEAARLQKLIDEGKLKGSIVDGKFKPATMDEAALAKNANASLDDDTRPDTSSGEVKAEEEPGFWGNLWEGAKEYGSSAAGLVGVQDDPKLWDEFSEVSALKREGKLTPERQAEFESKLMDVGRENLQAGYEDETMGPVMPTETSRRATQDIEAETGKPAEAGEVAAKVAAAEAAAQKGAMTDLEEEEKRRAHIKTAGAALLGLLGGGGSGKGGGASLLGGSQLIGASAPSGGALGNGLRFKDIV